MDLAGQAVESAEATDNHKALTDALVTMARASAQAGDPTEAAQLYDRAVALLREHGPQTSSLRSSVSWPSLLRAAATMRRPTT